MIGRHLTLLMLAVGPLACGSETSGHGPTGPVDLAEAPATLTMTCGAGSSVALEMPCLIGLDLSGQDPNGTGVHATECREASADRPLVWSFLFPLASARANPSTPLQAPADLPTVAGPGQPIDLAGDSVTMSSVTGALTFSRVDPSVRAFAGTFKGTIVWADQSGAQTSCQVDGPFWGGPGDFL